MTDTSRNQTGARGDDKETAKGADRLSLALLFVSIFALGAICGTLVVVYKFFPYQTVSAALTQIDTLKTRVLERDRTIAVRNRREYEVEPDAPAAANGLVLVAGMGADLVNFARVVDRGGNVVHEWRPDWFQIWPDDGYLPSDLRPQARPGTVIQGAQIAPDGDLVFHFENLSTVRLDPCGNVRWKLPNFGHHSVVFAEDGGIWVSAEREVEGAQGVTDKTYPGIRDFTIQKLSPEGEVLFDRSVIELLDESGFAGLTQMGHPDSASGDTLHTNDVEVFPRSMAPGFFGAGDIMISARQINTVVVFDPTARQVKFAFTGDMVRQHDPDFTSGNTITVFDNQDTAGSVPVDAAERSRVLEITAPSGAVREVFGGPAYFTTTMGRHQNLPNGNVLVTVPWQGQALEIAPDGRLVWQYENDVGDGFRGLLSSADLLPAEMDAAFFEGLRAGCAAAQ